MSVEEAIPMKMLTFNTITANRINPSIDGWSRPLPGSPHVADRLLLYGERALFPNAVGASAKRGADREQRQEE